VNIHFTLKSFEQYLILLKIEQLSKEGQKMRTQQGNTQKQAVVDSLEQRINATRESIMKEAAKYVDLR